MYESISFLNFSAIMRCTSRIMSLQPIVRPTLNTTRVRREVWARPGSLYNLQLTIEGARHGSCQHHIESWHNVFDIFNRAHSDSCFNWCTNSTYQLLQFGTLSSRESIPISISLNVTQMCFVVVRVADSHNVENGWGAWWGILYLPNMDGLNAGNWCGDGTASLKSSYLLNIPHSESIKLMDIVVSLSGWCTHLSCNSHKYNHVFSKPHRGTYTNGHTQVVCKTCTFMCVTCIMSTL